MAEHTRLAEFRKNIEDKMSSNFHDLAQDLSERWTQEAHICEERLIARISAMMEDRELIPIVIRPIEVRSENNQGFERCWRCLTHD